ncbi:MAG: hypothetical protein ACLU18_20680 [Bacteroides thetaiotaomicron]
MAETCGELSGTQYTPEKGWDENKVRYVPPPHHSIGTTRCWYVIHDELEGKEAVTWSYLLHTVELPMEIQELPDEVKVTGKNKAGGISVAHPVQFSQDRTSYCRYFLLCSTNWKNVTNARGKSR